MLTSKLIFASALADRAALAATLVLAFVALSACTTSSRAPVEERQPSASGSSLPTPIRTGTPSGAPVTDVRPPAGAAATTPMNPGATASPGTTGATRPVISGPTHTVQKGETLLGIAVAYGVDYRDLAAWNGVTNPSQLVLGQVLRVSAPADFQRPGSTTGASDATSLKPSSAVAQPTNLPGAVEARPIGSGAASATSPNTVPPIGLPSASTTQEGPRATTGLTALKTEPRASKVPYSDAALAAEAGVAPAAAIVPPSVSPTSTAPASVTPAIAAGAAQLGLAWPTKEKKIIKSYTESNKGIDIAGKKGDAVLAAGPGKVILATTLRGYGKIVIVQHSPNILTAYANNDKLLVKEGQQVKRGDRIADMGATDSDQVKLHFEVRKDGVPVDPFGYIPKP